MLFVVVVAQVRPISDAEKVRESFSERRVSVFLPGTLHAWLELEARSEGVAVSTYVRRLVIRARSQTSSANGI